MTTAWHVNEGLAPLVGQLESAHPGMVIGTIGDKAHREEVSDHNPNAAGRVNAADLMLGKAFTEAAALALLPFLIADSRTHYVIHNRRIWTSETGAWEPYYGDDPHTNHVHESVKDSAHNNTAPWKITPRKVTMHKLDTAWPEIGQGDSDDQLDGYNVIYRLQKITGAAADGDWGPETTAQIAAWCKISKSKATKLTEAIYRQVMGLTNPG
jgi:hypothetical protein